MEISDSFLTIKKSAESEIKIKGSRFVGRVARCDTEAEAILTLESVRKKFHDATHNCFAYRIGSGRDTLFRYSDDGEPSGTAGKPIYDRIEGHNLTNLILIVTRYFGGIKLGTGGLTRAYSEATQTVLDKAGELEIYITEQISLTIGFSDYKPVERIIYQLGAEIISSDFSEKIKLVVGIRLSLMTKLREALTNGTSGRILIE
jgi:uncharacterized YigZ family protein